MQINLPCPPSVNAMYYNRRRGGGGRGRIKSAKYRDWLRDADAYLMVQKRRLVPITGPYEVRIIVPRGRPDLDNLNKAVIDFLVSRELTPDDKHCCKITTERDPELNYCRVIVIERAA